MAMERDNLTCPGRPNMDQCMGPELFISSCFLLISASMRSSAWSTFLFKCYFGHLTYLTIPIHHKLFFLVNVNQYLKEWWMGIDFLPIITLYIYPHLLIFDHGEYIEGRTSQFITLFFWLLAPTFLDRNSSDLSAFDNGPVAPRGPTAVSRCWPRCCWRARIRSSRRWLARWPRTFAPARLGGDGDGD